MMEFRGGLVESDCESVDNYAADVLAKVAEDQRHVDRNLDSKEGAVSPECRCSDESEHSVCESKASTELLQSDGHRREATSKWTISLGSSSGAKQSKHSVCGETKSGHSSEVEEGLTAKADEGGERGGSQFLMRGGRGFNENEEEEPSPSTVLHEHSPANAAEGDEEHENGGGKRLSITRSNSTPVGNDNGGHALIPKLPSDLLEFSGRLSESFGMAIATVFHEVFERNGELGSRDSPVDEFTEILEAALKESLALVLGNERGLFVEKFRNSFRTNYQTMRSVKCAFENSGARHLYPHPLRGLQEKPSRVSPSRSYKGRARKNMDETHEAHKRKHLLVEYTGVTKNSVAARHPQHNVGTISEEEVSSSIPKTYNEPGHRVNFPGDSDRSCLNESLQSAFFTDGTLEQEGWSDNARSCSKSCLNESLESSFFTDSNPEQDGQDVTARSSFLNTLDENSASQISEAMPDATDGLGERSDTEGSWDVDMFSAMSSSESDEWVTVDRDDGAVLEITFDAWSSEKGHQHTGRVVEYTVNSPSMSSVVGDSKQHKSVSETSLESEMTVGCSDSSGRRVNEDSMPLGKPPKSAETSGKGVVDVSPQDTKSVGSRNSLGNHSYQNVQTGNVPRFSRSSSGRMHAINSLEHPGNRVKLAQRSQVTTLSASPEIGESSSGTEPRMNLQHPGEEADSFGRLHVAGKRSEEIMVHRRRGQFRGHETQLTGPLREDDALEVAPYFSYGVRASSQVLLERLVEAQEIQNHLKSLEIAHNKIVLNVQMDHLQLQSESNVLMKENVDVGRSRIDLKEFELEDRKLSAAHRELRQMCADELVAGLFVMFLALACSAWKFSYAQLSRVVTMCQLPVREPRRAGWLGTDWMANAMDAVTYRMQVMSCEVAKAGRMLAGLTLIAIVTTSLLSRSVTSNSQTMPATIIVVFLAGVCGLAGKVSIDSLGGSGYVWLLYWWLLCSLHLFATSCTSWLHKYLYGPGSKFYQTRTSVWMKSCSICARFSFHIFLALVLPLMAGFLPFASLDELICAFWELWDKDIIIAPP